MVAERFGETGDSLLDARLELSVTVSSTFGVTVLLRRVSVVCDPTGVLGTAVLGGSGESALVGKSDIAAWALFWLSAAINPVVEILFFETEGPGRLYSL